MAFVSWLFALNQFIILFFIFLFFIIFFITGIIKSKQMYNKFLSISSWIIFIWGMFGQGKTWLLAHIWSLIYNQKNTFFIANFKNSYSFINYSSFEDFCNILDDLLILGDYQNFNFSEKEEIKKEFPWYFEISFTEFEKKYKYIPKNLPCRFVVAGDEFHQYLYNRFAMVNFSWEHWKKLLSTLHQVRHYNTLLILSTQNVFKIDEALRVLCSYTIETSKNTFWFRFDIFNFLNDKEKIEEQKKINKFPLINFNFFELNEIINLINNFIKKFRKKILKKEDEKFLIKNFKTLKFESKFNVKIWKSIYKKWDLFKKLNYHYKNQK
jgi:hypothetical protein